MTDQIKQTPREQRYWDFEWFLYDADRLFRQVTCLDIRHPDRGKQYNFYVVPKGRQGAVDKRQCDIFYGLAPFDRVVDTSKFPSPPSSQLLVQDGGAIALRRSDDGYVACFIYPPKTKHLSTGEDAICLFRHKPPRLLTGKGYIGKIFRAYSSIFEYSILDGSPSTFDYVVYFYLRTTRLRVIDGTAHPPIVLSWLARVTTFALAVGLSGFLLKIAELYFASPCQC